MMHTMDISKLRLTDLRKDEKIVVVAWRHWFVLLREVVGLAILFILPFIFVPFVLSLLASQGVDAGASSGSVLFFGAFWALTIWNVLFTRWTDYYYDIWIVTNWRIIDVDQKGLFKRNISSILDLDHIQDIDTDIEGIIKTILDFGDIEVQTAGAKNEFSFRDVAHPRQIERLIRDSQSALLKLKQDQGHMVRGIE